MDKVLTTTEFVVWQMNNIDLGDSVHRLQLIQLYATLMQQPLELGMFVPCDELGNVLIHPKDDKDPKKSDEDFLHRQSDYHKARNEMLFEGWFFNEKRSHSGTQYLHSGEHVLQQWNGDIGVYIDKVKTSYVKKTIEDLARRISLTPTKAFMERIGLWVN